MDLTGAGAAPRFSAAATDPAGATGRLATWLAGTTLAGVPFGVREHIKNRARRLAAAFRATALPVVRVKVAFSADGGDLPPGRALIPGPESAPPAAYSEFPDDFLAWENSYNLIFAEDAITDVDAASRTHAFTKIFPRLGEIATTQQIIDTLDGRSVGLAASPAVGGPITRTSRRSENAGI
jgi:hypothetical protein